MTDFWHIIHKLRSTMFLVGGLIMLGMFLIAGTPPEDKLKLLEGIPTKSKLYYSSKSLVLQFYVGDKYTQYSQGDPHFRDVVAIVKSGTPVKLWIEDKGEWGPLCKLTANDQTIVSYEEAMKGRGFGKMVAGVLGSILAIVGGLDLFKSKKKV